MGETTEREAMDGSDGTPAAEPRPCAFCRIAAGEAPADVLYADDRLMAFLDVAPLNKGHALLILLEHLRGAAGPARRNAPAGQPPGPGHHARRQV